MASKGQSRSKATGSIKGKITKDIAAVKESYQKLERRNTELAKAEARKEQTLNKFYDHVVDVRRGWSQLVRDNSKKIVKKFVRAVGRDSTKHTKRNWVHLIIDLSTNLNSKTKSKYANVLNYVRKKIRNNKKASKFISKAGGLKKVETAMRKSKPRKRRI
jgi:DNA mismatch repair ATPase MutS